jgi:hypothetical protein
METRELRVPFIWRLGGLLRNNLTFRMFRDLQFCGTARALENRPSIEHQNGPCQKIFVWCSEPGDLAIWIR